MTIRRPNLSGARNICLINLHTKLAAFGGFVYKSPIGFRLLAETSTAQNLTTSQSANSAGEVRMSDRRVFKPQLQA
jgi:hypothetical protein